VLVDAYSDSVPHSHYRLNLSGTTSSFKLKELFQRIKDRPVIKPLVVRLASGFWPHHSLIKERRDFVNWDGTIHTFHYSFQA